MILSQKRYNQNRSFFFFIHSNAQKLLRDMIRRLRYGFNINTIHSPLTHPSQLQSQHGYVVVFQSFNLIISYYNENMEPWHMERRMLSVHRLEISNLESRGI